MVCEFLNTNCHGRRNPTDDGSYPHAIFGILGESLEKKEKFAEKKQDFHFEVAQI